MPMPSKIGMNQYEQNAIRAVYDQAYPTLKESDPLERDWIDLLTQPN